MLAVTENAATQIRNLTEQPELPEGVGLRIAAEGSGTLTLSLAAEPMAGDAIVDTAGARVFLDEQATVLLDDKSLDASVDGDGRVQFALAEQA